jgi:hypothetical protein
MPQIYQHQSRRYDMEKRNMMIIVGIVVVLCIAVAALYFSGAIHTGSFAAQGAKFGPGTYVVGTDIPEGRYSFDGPYDLEGKAIYQASSQGGLSLSENNVEVSSGATITIHDGGSMVYEGS